jgi:hypothetical protein
MIVQFMALKSVEGKIFEKKSSSQITIVTSTYKRKDMIEALIYLFFLNTL